MNNPLYDKHVRLGEAGIRLGAVAMQEARSSLSKTTSLYTTKNAASLTPGVNPITYLKGYRKRVNYAFQCMVYDQWLSVDGEGNYVLRLMHPYRCTLPGERIVVGAGPLDNPMLRQAYDRSTTQLGLLMNLNTFSTFAALKDYCLFEYEVGTWKLATEAQASPTNPGVMVMAQDFDQQVHFWSLGEEDGDRTIQRSEIVVVWPKDTSAWTKDQLRMLVEILDVVLSNSLRDALHLYRKDTVREALQSCERLFGIASAFCHKPGFEKKFYAAHLAL